MARIEPDPGSTLILGRGFNTLTSEELASAVAVDAKDVINTSGSAIGGRDVILNSAKSKL